MNNQEKKQLDRYSMMIVSKYFKSIWDFLKMVQICKKFKEIPEMFHFNPVPSAKKIKLFPNIETYHVYNKKENLVEGYNKYVYWYEMNYLSYSKKKENEEFKSVRFSLNDWKKYGSFKGATILGTKSLSQYNFEEIDLTGITKLEKNCFSCNSFVKRIKLDKRITVIPDECFSGCVSLVELDLSFIKILGNSCFNGCSSLTSLTLPEMLYKIGGNCFIGVNGIEKIETNGIKLIETNMNYCPYKLFKTNGIDVKGDISYNSYDRTKYGNEIPDVVSIIETYCFDGVATLEDVIIPKTVTKLEQNCFNFCSIKSIDLSNVVESNCDFIGCNLFTSITINKNIIKSSENNYYRFFNNLSILKNIELSDTNHIPVVSNHLRKLMNEKGYQYDNCIYTQSDRIETNYIIPEEINIIEGYVFYYQNEVKTITIPSNVTHIFPNNINSMGNLESIEIQSTNIKCDSNCFINLPNIEELDLRGITSFGNNCICDCSSLTKVIIQNVLIENGLNNCNSLKEIEIIGIKNNEYEHPIGYKIANILENKGIHCKRKTFNNYQAWDLNESYFIPDGVNEIETYSFQYCVLKEITIPSSVTLIKPFSFFYCQHLSMLKIEGNPKIGQKAFYGCPQLIQTQQELKQYF